MDHAQLLQAILSILLSGVSAIGGVKYAIKYFEKTADRHDKIINQLLCDMKKFTTHSDCKDSKIACRLDKSTSVADIMSKIDSLAKEVIEQNRRREDTKDENSKMYFDIAQKLTRLEARLEVFLDGGGNGK